MLRSLVRPILVFILAYFTSAMPDSIEEQAVEKLPQQEKATTYQLAYKFVPGQELHFYSEFRGKMAVRFKGATQIDKTATKLWKHFKVIDAAEAGSGTLPASTR